MSNMKLNRKSKSISWITLSIIYNTPMTGDLIRSVVNHNEVLTISHDLQICLTKEREYVCCNDFKRPLFKLYTSDFDEQK